MRLRVGLVLGCAAIPVIAVAEEKGTATEAERTAVYMQAGYSSGSSDMGGALGGMLVRDLTSRLSVEASASYLGHGMGTNGLSASAALLVHLRPTGEKAVPYLAAGGGLYRASFDMGNGRFNGPMNMGGSMMNGFGMMGLGSASAGTPWNYGQMPHFYGSRLANGTGTQGPYYGDRSFTDPAISLGGGIRIDVGSRLFLRPDARALVVTSSGDTNTVGVFTVSLGYRF
jgi:hypothetical protein